MLAPQRPLGIALDATLNGDNQSLTAWIAEANLHTLEKEYRRVEEIRTELTALRASYKQAQDREDQDACTAIAEKGTALRDELCQYTAQTTIRMYLEQGLEEQVSNEIILLLCWVQDMLNVQAPLTEDQMVTIAKIIVKQHKWLRKEDIALAMRNALAGVYGKLYGKVDAQDVLCWIQTYAEQLQEIRYQIASQNRAAIKEQPGEPMSDSMRAIFRRIDNKPIQ